MGLFDPQTDVYSGFKPPSYSTERGTINPMLWSYLQQQIAGKPTEEDWQWHNALNNQIAAQYKTGLNQLKSGLAARGMFDSGAMGKGQAGLLNQRAASEADILSQMYQNIMQRQMAAAGMMEDVLAGARAGSGTYQWKV